jgi:hypothetical protein
MVAMMLTYQPFYMGGIHNVEGAKRNTYGAMATFLFTFLLSVVYLVQDVIKNGGERSSRSRGRYHHNTNGPSDYDLVPTASALRVGGGDPAILQEYNTNLDLPMSMEQAQFT